MPVAIATTVPIPGSVGEEAEPVSADPQVDDLCPGFERGNGRGGHTASLVRSSQPPHEVEYI